MQVLLDIPQARRRATSPLPDFYIGAHAAVRGYRLLTRDAARYRFYYPTVELIAPSAP
jgi:predicted nucleic acid-binding protein